MKARALLAMLGVTLVVAGSVRAENRWALWERPLDVITQTHGAWRRTQVYDNERWCKGAMTTAINQTLRTGRKAGRRDPRAPTAEYQCLPETETPRE